MKPIFITGTDTGIGKTVFSLILVKWFFHTQCRPFYFKPFQTGCADPYDADSDARFVYDNVPELKENDPAESVGYCLPEPKAPLFAARPAGVRIDVDTVIKTIEDKQRRFSPLIVEGAGGLMVPVTDSFLIIDLVRKIECMPILVARAGLGTINHTLLSLSEMNRRGVPPIGVVLANSDQTEVPAPMIRENIEAIEAVSGTNVFGVMGRIDAFNAVLDDNAQAICRRIDQVITNEGKHKKKASCKAR